MVSLRLLETDKAIQGMIYSGLAKETQKHFNKVSGKISSAIKPIIIASLSSSPEIRSLSSGVLQADFGLTSDPSTSIINSVSNSISVQSQKVTTNGSNINGGFTVYVQPSDYSNLLSLPIATQAIEGGSLPWLKWLLTLGDTIIIAGFGVEYGPHGRTGKARMTEDNRPFKVNSAFSGSIDDNFITRAIKKSEKAVTNAIIKAIQ